MRRHVALFVLLAACAHQNSMTRHVRADGDDAHPGDERRPFRTLAHALANARPGQRIVVHGRIDVAEPLRITRSGEPSAWIVLKSADDQPAVLDASRIVVPPPQGDGPQPHDDGVITLRNVHHVAVVGLRIRHAPLAGIAIRDSSDVAVLDNRIEHTFGSGIAAWDSDHDSHGTERIRIVGNTVVRSNDASIAPAWFPRDAEPPHEAVSLGGVADFEVGYNEIAEGRKEGIDIKENSREGRVHHNLVHGTARQGLYVDAWFGTLHDVEIDHNLVTQCRGAGLAIAVEQGDGIQNLEIHDNVLADNLGTGLLFGRWGADGPREHIVVRNNTIRHNGHGPPADGQRFFWITGGIFLYSPNLEHLRVRDNLVVDNRGFQIGLGDAWQDEALATRAIVATDNAVRGDRADPPIHVGWPENFADVREWTAGTTSPLERAGTSLQRDDVGPAALPPDERCRDMFEPRCSEFEGD